MPILGVIASGISGHLSVFGNDWTNGYSLPTTNYPFTGQREVYGNGTFVTMAEDSIRISSDGVNYTSYPYPDIANFKNNMPLIHNGSVFAYMVYTPTATRLYNIYTSTNGITWTNQGEPSLSGATGTVEVSPSYYSGGLFWDGSKYGFNGKNNNIYGCWTSSSLMGPYSHASTTFGANIYSYGPQGNSSVWLQYKNGRSVAYSTNQGASWTESTVTNGDSSSIGGGAGTSGRYFIQWYSGSTGYIAYASGGSGWTNVALPNSGDTSSMNGVTDNGNISIQFPWYGNYYHYSTNNGQSYTKVSTVPLGIEFGSASAFYNNGRFFFRQMTTIGGNGPTYNTVIYPGNLNVMQIVNMGSTPQALVSPRFVVSNGTSGAVVGTARDSFVLAQGGLTGTRYQNVFDADVNSGSVLNVGGTTYYFAGGGTNYWYSTNGSSWSKVTAGGTGSYNRCVYNGSVFVSHSFYANYIRHGTGISAITNSGFVNGNGHAVCDPAVDPTNKIWTYLIGVGTNQFVYCTTNATQGGWTQFTGPTNPDGYWYCNTTVNGTNILAGPGGTKIAWKTGDVTVNNWNIQTVPYHSVREIQYINGLYVMLMAEISGSQATPRLMYSPDLVTWTLASNYPASYWTNQGIRANYAGTGSNLTYDGVAAVWAINHHPNILVSN
jgi:hypothetical protein